MPWILLLIQVIYFPERGATQQRVVVAQEAPMSEQECRIKEEFLGAKVDPDKLPERKDGGKVFYSWASCVQVPASGRRR